MLRRFLCWVLVALALVGCAQHQPDCKQPEDTPKVEASASAAAAASAPADPARDRKLVMCGSMLVGSDPEGELPPPCVEAGVTREDVAPLGRVIANAPVPLDLPAPASENKSIALTLVSLPGGKMRVELQDGATVGMEAVPTNAEIATLKGMIKPHVAPEVRAIIRADKAVTHGSVIAVIDALKQLGVMKIAFAVR
jgi:biopolymer transport protein ExbD